MVANDHTLVVGDGPSLRVVDLTRSDGAVVGRHDFEQPVLGLALEGDTLYVANSHEGLFRIDVPRAHHAGHQKQPSAST